MTKAADPVPEAGQTQQQEQGASKPQGLTRRAFTVGAVSLAALVGLGFAGTASADDGSILRPPGGQDASRFLQRCLHCERCREACPHDAIVPLGIERGIAAARTPTMDFLQGWCNFCEDTAGGFPRCAASCPTGALSIPADSVPKRDEVIGIAVITRDWCIAWQNRNCRVCVDECPYDALEFDGSDRPVVVQDRCNGCGRCENVCISMTSASVAPEATARAITVRPSKEVQSNGSEA